jgi:hypothetical protein
MKTGYYACLSKQLFSIGHLGMEVFEVLPINTPIKIHQIITVEDDGREVISDGDDLIQSKLELWKWLSNQSNLIFIEFSHPGQCTWTLHQGQLSIFCHHRPTLIWWTAEILKFYHLGNFKNFHRLSTSEGQKCLLLSKDIHEAFGMELVI